MGWRERQRETARQVEIVIERETGRRSEKRKVRDTEADREAERFGDTGSSQDPERQKGERPREMMKVGETEKEKGDSEKWNRGEIARGQRKRLEMVSGAQVEVGSPRTEDGDCPPTPPD